jgi:hypothetical protein
LFATATQPASYNPVRDTISELAGQGATNAWAMTSALVGVGLCYLLSALGLYPAERFGRALLASGGVATLLIAVLRQPRHGYSLGHELAVIAAALTCRTWPAFVWRQQHPAPLLRPIPSVGAAGGSIGLATWYALEGHGALLGLAERCAAAAVPLWLLAVVVTTRRALMQGTASRGASGGKRTARMFSFATRRTERRRSSRSSRPSQRMKTDAVTLAGSCLMSRGAGRTGRTE